MDANSIAAAATTTTTITTTTFHDAPEDLQMNLNCATMTPPPTSTINTTNASVSSNSTVIAEDSPNNIDLSKLSLHNNNTQTMMSPSGDNKTAPGNGNVDDVVFNCRRIQVSREKRPLNFFVTLSKKFLLTDNVIELSGLGLAVTTVVTVAELLKSQNLVSIKHVKTSLVTPNSEDGNNNRENNNRDNRDNRENNRDNTRDTNNNNSHEHRGGNGGGNNNMAPKAKIQIWIEKTPHFDVSAPSFGYQMRNTHLNQQNAGQNGTNINNGNSAPGNTNPHHHHHHHHHHINNPTNKVGNAEDLSQENPIDMDMNNNNGHHMMLSAAGGVEVIPNNAPGNGYQLVGDGNNAGHT